MRSSKLFPSVLPFLLVVSFPAPGAVGAGGKVAPAEAPACVSEAPLPKTVSASGCYADVPRKIPMTALVPYEVTAQLWTDGAAKRRYVGVPAGAAAKFGEDGVLALPVGSTVMKEFRLSTPAGDRLVETRLMRKRPDGWELATYVWNDAGTDAVRLEKPLVRTFQVRTPEGPQPLAYEFPGPTGCTTCHGPAGEVLGPTAAQLSRKVRVGTAEVDQLDHLRARGVLAAGAVQVPAAQKLVDPADPRAPLDHRARSYLHTNCAHCHRPGGWAPPTLTLDLRIDRPLAETQTCNVSTQYFEIAPRVSPGMPFHSALWRRMRARGLERMPPIGTTMRDPAADVVREWIATLERCPE